MIEVRCKVCDLGTLLRRKKYRMSWPVVTIGYILLIPSVLGIVVSVFMMISLASAHDAARAGSDFVTGFAFLFGVASFVSGLIGWLLVMKKQVLECTICKAVVNAS